jgi:hypothetical protein
MAAREMSGFQINFMGHMGCWQEFSSHTRFEVDDGFKIRFWHDKVWGSVTPSTHSTVIL